MEQARIFKYETVSEPIQTAFVYGYDEQQARKELQKFTQKSVRIVGARFYDDIPGNPETAITTAKIIKNEIDPF